MITLKAPGAHVMKFLSAEEVSGALYENDIGTANKKSL